MTGATHNVTLRPPAGTQTIRFVYQTVDYFASIHHGAAVATPPTRTHTSDRSENASVLYNYFTNAETGRREI